MAVQKTSISILQELMQRNQKPIPAYHSSNVTDLNGNFTCMVAVDGIEIKGYGKTKKEAKHNSAKTAITILQNKSTNSLINTTDVVIAPRVSRLVRLHTENHIGALNEFCSKNSISYPEYKENEFDGQNFNITCSLNEINVLGKGINKKIAKQEAARIVLDKLKLTDKWKNKITRERSPKLALDDSNIRKITELYNNLTIEKKYIPSELNISTEIDFTTSNIKLLKDTGILPLEQEECPPMEKSEENLRNMGIEDYSISIFVKEPLMLIFKAEKVTPATFTLIQDGATYTEIKKILLATAVKFIDILNSQ